MVTWRPDILGPGFECLDIDLGEDDEGPLVATLVRHLPPHRNWWRSLLTPKPLLQDVDVVYVHGWSDYFFQRRLAQFWAERGANFYALELRKYGRSLREGQTAGYIDDLTQYDEEIERALQIIRPSQQGVNYLPGHAGETENAPSASDPDTTEADGAEVGEIEVAEDQPALPTTVVSTSATAASGQRPLILFGHSTGGLVLSLWASRHPGVADAVVLNSPWLEFQLTRMGRHMLTPLVDLRARFHAKESSSGLDPGFYARAQEAVRDDDDPYEVNLTWRPERSHPISAGWLRAVLRGHNLVDHGLNIDVPICVLLSAHSTAPLKWSETLTRSDTVLDVQEVARAALKLGDSVTIEWIDGALHDVFLSRRDARDEAYRRLDRWARGWAASRRAG